MGLLTKVGGTYIVLPMGAFDPNTDISYTGTKTVIDDGNGHWRIKLLTDGVLTVAKPISINAFLVGGGGAANAGGFTGGGGGGYTTTGNASLSVGTNYTVDIGAGGNAGDGAATTAFSLTANGGKLAVSSDGKGGAGGSGGGGNGSTTGGAGGSNGSNGTQGSWPGGTGQGTTTREFGEAGGDLYGGGGGGGVNSAGSEANYGVGGAGGGGRGGSYTTSATAGTANTGGGGGGSSQSGGNGAQGGSGIVVIRDAR